MRQPPLTTYTILWAHKRAALGKKRGWPYTGAPPPIKMLQDLGADGRKDPGLTCSSVLHLILHHHHHQRKRQACNSHLNSTYSLLSFLLLPHGLQLTFPPCAHIFFKVYTKHSAPSGTRRKQWRKSIMNDYSVMALTSYHIRLELPNIGKYLLTAHKRSRIQGGVETPVYPVLSSAISAME